MSDPATLLDALGRHRRAVDTCVYCPKLCRHVCPVAVEEARETSTPWALMLMVAFARDGREPPGAEWGEALAHCVGCGRCRRACLHDNDVLPPLHAARALAWEVGAAPAGARARVAGDEARRAAAAARLASLFPDAPGRAGAPAGGGARVAGYFPGCVAGDAAEVELRAAHAAVLGALGAGPLPVVGRGDPDGACCGEALLELGAVAEHAAAQARLGRALDGLDLVVVLDPHCAASAKRARPGATVTTAAELLAAETARARAGGGGGAETGAPRPCVFHGPCGVGPDSRAARAAQAVARAHGYEPVPLPDGERASASCGAGGGLPDTVAATAQALARHVREVADETAARAGLAGAPLVAGSVRCAAHLRASGVAVRSVFELD